MCVTRGIRRCPPQSSNPVASCFRNQWRDLSLRNSRGDWTPLELFIAGVRGWEAGSRRFIDTSDSCKYRFKEKH